MIGALVNVALPKSQDGVTTRRHVSVLGGVKLHSLSLPGVWFGELVRVSMPILTIELNHDAAGMDKGVNAEFVTYKMLGQVLNPQVVKEAIARLFELVRTELLLFDVHLNELGSTVRVGITTLKRAIGDVVSVVTRRRPVERLTAYLASVSDLIPGLPLIQALKATKARLINAPGGHIVGLAAPLAHFVLAVLTLGTLAGAIAIQGAVSLAGARALGYGLPAATASDCPDLVLAFHALTIPQFGPQSNRWGSYATP